MTADGEGAFRYHPEYDDENNRPACLESNGSLDAESLVFESASTGATVRDRAGC